MKRINKFGKNLLLDPFLNKSTAFTDLEREEFGLTGLLPETVEPIELQLKRVFIQLGHKLNNIDRYIYLMNLLDHNETLFYKTLMSNPAYFLPIIYAPTIGEACLKFDHIYLQPRGMYISFKHKGQISKILENWPEKDVRIICVTNGGRILGLGDLGANGMGIPIGKLQLYTAAAGVPPQYLLPVCIDVGTDNEGLLQDPFYIGLRQPRIKNEELYEFADEFVEAVQKVFPNCCIHFEDWGGADAVLLLERYRNKISCYNDDIQGTASVFLAGMLNACKIKGNSLKDERYLFLGAGSAAIGLSNFICSTLVKDYCIPIDEARQSINMFDNKGLLEESRTDLFDFQIQYAHSNEPMVRGDFAKAIKKFKPTVLVGLSTVGAAFTKEIIEAISEINERPIILALSNPTEHAECTAEQAYYWSKGKAIYAAGVPFNSVQYKGSTFSPGQANNFYIFPAIGMAIYATKALRVTDEMFVEAAKALAEQVTPSQLQQGALYPLQSDILEIETKIAIKIVKLIFASNLARVKEPSSYEDFIKDLVYKPKYTAYTQ